MKIIITENQQESIKIELQSMVKDIGWELTAKIVNGPKKLAKLAFNNGPMEFLNLFNDLDVVQSKKNPNCTLFKYKKVNNVMVLLSGNVNIDYNKIWSFLGEGFGLDFYQTKKLTELWLSDAYNLEGTRTNYYDYSVPF